MKESPQFTKTIIESICESNTVKTLSKGTFLLREGDIEKHVYFVESGALRIFYLTELEEHTIRFGYKGSIINSLSSFIQGKPSEFYIEAIRKTKIRMITKESFMNLVYQSDESQKQYIHLLQILITQQIEREIDLLITSPLQRLERVIQRSPDLFQHIPLKYIAFYLRMSPETLSRIRNS